jgi:hypothetical protein
MTRHDLWLYAAQWGACNRHCVPIADDRAALAELREAIAAAPTTESRFWAGGNYATTAIGLTLSSPARRDRSCRATARAGGNWRSGDEDAADHDENLSRCREENL